MRKWLLVLLTLTCIACCILGIAACAPADLRAHTWEYKWTHNEDQHWRRCTVAGCGAKTNIGDHEWVLTETEIPESCGTNGQGIYTCSVCGATKRDMIAATGSHNYLLVSTEIPATCFSSGLGTFLCSSCSEMNVLTIPATGEHDFTGAWVGSAEGHCHSCQTPGCTATDEIVPHTKAETPVTVQAGKLKDGSENYYCSDCNELVESVPLYAPDIPRSFDIELTYVRTGEKVVLENGTDGIPVAHIVMDINGENNNNRYWVRFVNCKDGNGNSFEFPTVRDENGDQVYEYHVNYDNKGSGMHAYQHDEVATENTDTFIDFWGTTGYNGSIRYLTDRMYVYKNISSNGVVVIFRFEILETGADGEVSSRITTAESWVRLKTDVPAPSAISVIADEPVYYVDKKSQLQ